MRDIETQPPALRMTDVAVVFVVAWVVAALYRTIWPLIEGRDFPTYAWYYVDMWQPAPRMPFLMVYRTPLIPLFIGGLAQLGGLTALWIAMNSAYAVAVTATYCIGAFWNRATGVAAAVIVLGYVGFGALFREVSSDAPFAAVFLAWCAWIVWTHRRTTISTYVIHGIWVAALTLIRPASQAYLIFALFPWVVAASDFRTRIRCAAAFVATAAVLLGAFATYNAIRYQDFTIARGGNAINPFYRAFITARIVREANGPASHELAEAIRADLINHDPYKAYGVTDTMIFEDGDARAWSDLVCLSDRTWGWSSRYSMLRRAAFEAIAANPKPFLAGIAHDTVATFGIIGYPPPMTPTAPAAPIEATKPVPAGLPAPTEGQRIPTSYAYWLASTPTGEVLPATGEQPALYRRIATTITPKPGRPGVADFLQKGQAMFPPPILWLLMGAIGTIHYGGVQRRIFYMLIAMAVIAPMAGVIGQGLVYHYRLPFDPLFIAFGVAGFLRTGLSRVSTSVRE